MTRVGNLLYAVLLGAAALVVAQEPLGSPTPNPIPTTTAGPGLTPPPESSPTIAPDARRTPGGETTKTLVARRTAPGIMDLARVTPYPTPRS